MERKKETYFVVTDKVLFSVDHNSGARHKAKMNLNDKECINKHFVLFQYELILIEH